MSCKEELETIHEMSLRLTDCEKCGQTNSLMKMLYKIHIKKTDNNVGTVVKEYIENEKEELKNEKDRLSKKQYSK